MKYDEPPFRHISTHHHIKETAGLPNPTPHTYSYAGLGWVNYGNLPPSPHPHITT